MRLLLDTHVVLWLMKDDPSLSTDARAIISAATEVFVSAATLWEIAIKSSTGKLDVNAERLVERISEAGLSELPVTFKHGIASGKLPFHHRDPFDRLLVAQAITEPMNFLTADPQLKSYSELVKLL